MVGGLQTVLLTKGKTVNGLRAPASLMRKRKRLDWGEVIRRIAPFAIPKQKKRRKNLPKG